MKGRYDVIHSHFGWDLMVPGVAANLVGVEAVVMSCHLGSKFRIRGLAMTRVLYDGIIAVSEFVGRLLLEQGIGRERVFVVRNGIDAARWRAGEATPTRKELSVPGDAFLVVAVGNMSFDKGFAYLVQAIAIARRRGINAFAVIAGRGDALPLNNLIASLGLSPFVIHLGLRQDIPGLFAAADAVAVPSNCPEAFPYAALEGLASGRPVVASRVGGLVETVTPQVGYLLPPGDPEAISQAIEELASDRDKCRRMGEAALARAEQFGLDECVSKLERVYECLLNRSSNGAEPLHLPRS
jgi:glycosyltransferase involved in cell wall biosynthesis